LGGCSQQNAESAESDVLAGKASEFRATVLLVDSSMNVACTGTLIGKDIVLTAAHCAEGISKAVIDHSEVLPAGASTVSPPSERVYGFRNVKKHPGYVSGGCPMVQDAMLVQLDRAVEGIKPVALGSAPEVGEECRVIGFGRHNVDGSTEVVESAATTRVGERREARVRLTEVPTATAFSAKGIDGAHSRGDSGGTLVCGSALKGIVSCTPNRDLRVLDLTKFYASVDSAKPFIVETLREWGASLEPGTGPDPVADPDPGGDPYIEPAPDSN
jgi:trypsin